jgi:hypothetical protein
MRLLARDGTIDALLLLRSNTIIDYTAAGEPELRVCCSRVEASSARLNLIQYRNTTVRHYTLVSRSPVARRASPVARRGRRRTSGGAEGEGRDRESSAGALLGERRVAKCASSRGPEGRRGPATYRYQSRRTELGRQQQGRARRR